MQEEVHADFFGVNHFFDRNGAIWAIAVHVEGLYVDGVIPAGEEEVIGPAWGFPFLCVHDLFGLIVDVVDWGFDYVAVFVSEGVEDWVISQAETICQLLGIVETVCVFLEMEFGLANGSFIVA